MMYLRAAIAILVSASVIIAITTRACVLSARQKRRLMFANFVSVIDEINRMTAYVCRSDGRENLRLEGVGFNGDRFLGIAQGVHYQLNIRNGTLCLENIPDVESEPVMVSLFDERLPFPLTTDIEALVRQRRELKP